MNPEENTLSQDRPTASQTPLLAPVPGDDDITQSQDNEATQIQDSLPAASAMSIEDWVDKLRCSDRAFYNIMAMEVWSLAKSMDTIEPGFWNRFMVNRRDAMQDFVERRRQQDQPTDNEPTAGDR
jgi:hypothetical protein